MRASAASPTSSSSDGGKPQLSAALEMFDEMGIDDIAMCGLAKRDEELFVPWQDTGPVVLPSGSASLYLVKQVRDEAHRFAITFHRELRGKGMTASILDDVTGMGPVRKKALLKAFKSFRNPEIPATLEEIKAARVVPEEVAEELYRVLQQYNRERKDERVVEGRWPRCGRRGLRPRVLASDRGERRGPVRSEPEG